MKPRLVRRGSADIRQPLSLLLCQHQRYCSSGLFPARAYHTSYTDVTSRIRTAIRRPPWAMPAALGSKRSLLLEMREIKRETVHSNDAYCVYSESFTLSISSIQTNSPGRHYAFDWSQSVSIGMRYPTPSSYQANATKGRLMDTAFRDREIDLESFSRLVVEVKQSSKLMSSRDDISSNGPEVQVPCTPLSFVQVLCTPDLATTCSSKSLDGKVKVLCTPSFVEYCMSKATQGIGKTPTLEQ